eukprot:3299163-Prymnesium_polylepis.2
MLTHTCPVPRVRSPNPLSGVRARARALSPPAAPGRCAAAALQPALHLALPPPVEARLGVCILPDARTVGPLVCRVAHAIAGACDRRAARAATHRTAAHRRAPPHTDAHRRAPPHTAAHRARRTVARCHAVLPAALSRPFVVASAQPRSRLSAGCALPCARRRQLSIDEDDFKA